MCHPPLNKGNPTQRFGVWYNVRNVNRRGHGGRGNYRSTCVDGNKQKGLYPIEIGAMIGDDFPAPNELLSCRSIRSLPQILRRRR